MSNLIVKEKPLINNDGLISGNRIAIRKNIATTTEKACVLAEELGHHYTTTGNILDQQNVVNAKQELHARTWAYNECIGLIGIVKAFESGCKSLYPNQNSALHVRMSSAMSRFIRMQTHRF